MVIYRIEIMNLCDDDKHLVYYLEFMKGGVVLSNFLNYACIQVIQHICIKAVVRSIQFII